MHNEVRVMPVELIVRFAVTIIIFIIIIIILSKFRAKKSQTREDDSLEMMKKDWKAEKLPRMILRKLKEDAGNK